MQRETLRLDKRGAPETDLRRASINFRVRRVLGIWSKFQRCHGHDSASIVADLGAQRHSTFYTVQYSTAFSPITIAIPLDSATNPRGFSAACHVVPRRDRTARTIAKRITHPKITKLASVPNPPPMQAPSDSRFWLEEYTANSATPFCIAATKRATTHRIVPSSNVFKSAQCSSAYWSLPAQCNDAVTVFFLSRITSADVFFGFRGNRTFAQSAVSAKVGSSQTFVALATLLGWRHTVTKVWLADASAIQIANLRRHQSAQPTFLPKALRLESKRGALRLPPAHQPTRAGLPQLAKSLQPLWVIAAVPCTSSSRL